MQKKFMALLLSIGALVAFAGVVAAQPTAQAAGAKGEARLDVVVAIPSPPSSDGTSPTATDIVAAISGQSEFIVDSFFDISYAAANIGSSGLDGVRISSFNVDSFFDIEYEIFGDPDFAFLAISVTEALADPSNPGAAIDAVDDAVRKAGGYTHHGHVTVLK